MLRPREGLFSSHREPRWQSWAVRGHLAWAFNLGLRWDRSSTGATRQIIRASSRVPDSNQLGRVDHPAVATSASLALRQALISFAAQAPPNRTPTLTCITEKRGPCGNRKASGECTECRGTGVASPSGVGYCRIPWHPSGCHRPRHRCGN